MTVCIRVRANFSSGLGAEPSLSGKYFDNSRKTVNLINLTKQRAINELKPNFSKRPGSSRWTEWIPFFRVISAKIFNFSLFQLVATHDYPKNCFARPRLQHPGPSPPVSKPICMCACGGTTGASMNSCRFSSLWSVCPLNHVEYLTPADIITAAVGVSGKIGANPSSHSCHVARPLSNFCRRLSVCLPAVVNIISRTTMLIKTTRRFLCLFSVQNAALRLKKHRDNDNNNFPTMIRHSSFVHSFI